MAQQNLVLRGKVKWAKFSENNLDDKFGDAIASCNFYPDDPSLIVMTAAGSRAEVKEDEDGRFVKLKRKLTSTYTDKKTKQVVVEEIGLPAVGHGLDEKGNLIPFTGLIGNGSTVDVKVSVYDTKFGKGTRLEAVNILELVEYIPGPKGPRDPNDLYKF